MKKEKDYPVYGEYNYGKKCDEMDCAWHKCKKCVSHDKCHRESMKKQDTETDELGAFHGMTNRPPELSGGLIFIKRI